MATDPRSSPGQWPLGLTSTHGGGVRARHHRGKSTPSVQGVVQSVSARGTRSRVRGTRVTTHPASSTSFAITRHCAPKERTRLARLAPSSLAKFSAALCSPLPAHTPPLGCSAAAGGHTVRPGCSLTPHNWPRGRSGANTAPTRRTQLPPVASLHSSPPDNCATLQRWQPLPSLLQPAPALRLNQEEKGAAGAKKTASRIPSRLSHLPLMLMLSSKRLATVTGCPCRLQTPRTHARTSALPRRHLPAPAWWRALPRTSPSRSAAPTR